MFVLGEDVLGLGFGMGFVDPTSGLQVGVRDVVSRVGCNF